ncbi:MAG: ARMT1-like domain-containing protein [Halanaerobiales bacterium]
MPQKALDYYPEIVKIIETAEDHLHAALIMAAVGNSMDASEEFKKYYREADIRISKGQGNLEGLSEEKQEIYFLLKAKCELVAELLKVNVGDLVFVLNS